MDESRSWSLIELGWDAVGGKAKTRLRLAAGKLSEERAYELAEVLDDAVVPALRKHLEDLTSTELLAFDRILERKLYDIDREDIHERTDGSDDGFLYCRGFIVGMGQAYFTAVVANPDRVVMDAECEAMCYLSWHLYEERFGEVPPSGISRETQANSAGWPSEGSGA